MLDRSVVWSVSLIMVRDRIAELCASQRNEYTFGRSLLEDVHMAMMINRKVNNVLGEAEQIRELIDVLVANIRAVRELHDNVLSHTNPDISKELDGRTFIIGQTAKRIRDKLREMAKDIPNAESLATLQAAREGPAHMRMKTVQYTTMQQMFSDIMLDYNEMLLRYHEKCSSLLNHQRVLIRKPNANSNSADRYSKEDETEEKMSLFVDNENSGRQSSGEAAIIRNTVATRGSRQAREIHRGNTRYIP